MQILLICLYFFLYLKKKFLKATSIVYAILYNFTIIKQKLNILAFN